MEAQAVVLADRKAPWETTNWMGGRKGDIDPDQLMTTKDMLEAAGMAGWNVQKKALYVGRKGPQVTEAFANVASDGRILGINGRNYVNIQCEDAFSFGDSIVESGEAKWERSGYFRGGRTVFGAMELTHMGISVPGDDSEIRPYLLIVNSFDGWSPLQGVIAFIRPICQNTLQAARATDTPYRFSIRHSGTLDGKVQAARDALGIAFKHTAEVGELTQALALKSIVDDQVLEIFRTAVWPVDADTKSEGHLEAHASTQAFNNYLSSPTIDGIRGTAWGALNAVTEYVDHVAEYKGGKVHSADDIRGHAILFGRGQTVKDRALGALVKTLK